MVGCSGLIPESPDQLGCRSPVCASETEIDFMLFYFIFEKEKEGEKEIFKVRGQ